MAIKFLNREAAKAEITKGGIVVVNAYADWCGPCQMFAPVLEEVSEEYNVIKIDVDKDREFAVELGVKGIPATFIFKDSKVVDTLVGFVPKEVVVEKLSAL